MRIDLFLKHSRLCLRRTVAQQMCDAGLVLINGHPAKSATAVKLGDELLLRRGTRKTKVRVLALPNTRQTSRNEAGALYETLSEVREADD